MILHGYSFSLFSPLDTVDLYLATFLCSSWTQQYHILTQCCLLFTLLHQCTAVINNFLSFLGHNSLLKLKVSSHHLKKVFPCRHDLWLACLALYLNLHSSKSNRVVSPYSKKLLGSNLPADWGLPVWRLHVLTMPALVSSHSHSQRHAD